jgi:general secretion pathway protein A
MAWDGLLRRWALAPVNGESACDTAARHGLGCHLATSGSLDLLASLDRPAVLTLHPRAARHRGAADRAGRHRRHGGRGRPARRLPLGELALAWQGEFGVLWRLPEGYLPAARAARPSTTGWTPS